MAQTNTLTKVVTGNFGQSKEVQTKLRDYDVQEILFLLNNTSLTQRHIGAIKKVSRETISRISSRRYHKDVDNPALLPADPKKRAHSMLLASFLRVAIRLELFASTKRGAEVKELSRAFNVPDYFVRRQIEKVRGEQFK